MSFDRGGRHFQDVPGQVRLADRLLAWLNHWRVAHLVADESGVGAGLVDGLAAKLGRDNVTGYSFSLQSKASLGSKFISVIETGRFKYWSSIDEMLSDHWWFFQQVQACTFYLPPGGQFEKHLRWYVPDAAKASTPTGLQPIHDDRLISAALVAVYDDLFRTGKLNLGVAKSTIIPPKDPLKDLDF